MEKQNKKQRTHQKILNVAYELFYKNGYDSTSYGEIAKAAGVGYGTVYSHFPNKEAIIVEQILRLIHEQSNILAAHEQGGRTDLEHVYALVDLAWMMFSNFPTRLLTAYMAHRWTSERASFLLGNAARESVFDVVKGYLRQAQTKGKLDGDIDIDALMWMIDASFIKSVQAAHYTEADNIAAHANLHKMLRFLFRQGSEELKPTQ